MSQKQIRKMVVSAMLAALTCVATMVIQIPSFGPSGYINLGDCMVLMSAWLLGGGAGALAAGIGSGMADMLTGYAFYAPGTFVIKLLMALAAYVVCKKLSGGEKAALPAYIVSAVCAEAIMILGYLFYEAIILGYGAAALAAVISNAIQGSMNAVIGIALVLSMAKAGVLKRLEVQ